MNATARHITSRIESAFSICFFDVPGGDFFSRQAAEVKSSAGGCANYLLYCAGSHPQFRRMVK